MDKQKKQLDWAAFYLDLTYFILRALPGQPHFLSQPDVLLFWEIGRAHVWTPVTRPDLVCRLLLEKKKKQTTTTTNDKQQQQQEQQQHYEVEKQRTHVLPKTREQYE